MTDELAKLLRECRKFMFPEVKRGPAVYGWSDLLQQVNEALSQHEQRTTSGCDPDFMDALARGEHLKDLTEQRTAALPPPTAPLTVTALEERRKAIHKAIISEAHRQDVLPDQSIKEIDEVFDAALMLNALQADRLISISLDGSTHTRLASEWLALARNNLKSMSEERHVANITESHVLASTGSSDAGVAPGLGDVPPTPTPETDGITWSDIDNAYSRALEERCTCGTIDFGCAHCSAWEIARSMVKDIERQRDEARRLAYVGDHHFPGLTWKSRCEELVIDLRKAEAERDELQKRLDEVLIQPVPASVVITSLQDRMKEKDAQIAKLKDENERILPCVNLLSRFGCYAPDECQGEINAAIDAAKG